MQYLQSTRVREKNPHTQAKKKTTTHTQTAHSSVTAIDHAHFPNNYSTETYIHLFHY